MAYLDAGVLARDWWLDEGSVAEHHDCTASDKPEDQRERRCQPHKGQTDDKETSVETLLGYNVVSYLHGLWC